MQQLSKCELQYALQPVSNGTTTFGSLINHDFKGTMTSVPKPLKFLRPYYDDIKGRCATVSDKATKVLPYENIRKLESPSPFLSFQAIVSDVVSLLAMTQEEEGSRDCLTFRLTGSDEKIETFGHEYVRCFIEEYVFDSTQN